MSEILLRSVKISDLASRWASERAVVWSMERPDRLSEDVDTAALPTATRIRREALMAIV